MIFLYLILFFSSCFSHEFIMNFLKGVILGFLFVCLKKNNHFQVWHDILQNKKTQERGERRSGSFFFSSSERNISRFIIWNHERQNPEPIVWSLQFHFGILRHKPVWLNLREFSTRLHHCLHFLKPLNHEWIRLKKIIIINDIYNFKNFK